MRSSRKGRCVMNEALLPQLPSKRRHLSKTTTQSHDSYGLFSIINARSCSHGSFRHNKTLVYLISSNLRTDSWTVADSRQTNRHPRRLSVSNTTMVQWARHCHTSSEDQQISTSCKNETDCRSSEKLNVLKKECKTNRFHLTLSTPNVAAELLIHIQRSWI